MPLPREVVPGRCYLITRRCTQRQFLLRPDAETNNAFIYCLGEAAQRFEIDVLLPSAMSNHHHTVIFDRHGNYPDFLEHFHKMLARVQNSLRGRNENFWASGQTSVVRLVDLEDVLRKLVYAATNPVKDGLVEKVHHWPGVNGLSALVNRRTLRATRPRDFFRSDGPMPAEITLTLAIPPEIGDDAEIRRELTARVAEAEATFARERHLTGARVVSRREVLRQSWRSTPKSDEERGGLQPRVAAVNKWSRIEALQRNREFVVAYREARKSWLAGLRAEFPLGTYWLRRFAAVPLAPHSTRAD